MRVCVCVCVCVCVSSPGPAVYHARGQLQGHVVVLLGPALSGPQSSRWSVVVTGSVQTGEREAEFDV